MKRRTSPLQSLGVTRLAFVAAFVVINGIVWLTSLTGRQTPSVALPAVQVPIAPATGTMVQPVSPNLVRTVPGAPTAVLQPGPTSYVVLPPSYEMPAPTVALTPPAPKVRAMDALWLPGLFTVVVVGAMAAILILRPAAASS